MSGYKIKKGCVNTPNFAENTIQSNCITQRYDYIPIDFLKCEIIGLSLDHFKQNNIYLIQHKRTKEDECEYILFISDNIEIKYYLNSKTDRITIEGSLHKYFNKGLHNHNHFTYENYLNVLERLKNELGIRPENLRILQLEYGVNISPPIPTTEILNNILFYSTNEFTTPKNNKRGHYKNVDFQQYELKIYDKRKQYKCQNDILRIEVKAKQWCNYKNFKKSYKIETLEDFNKADKSVFINDLLKKWNEVTFFDPTNIKNDTNYKQYLEFSNPSYFRGLISKNEDSGKYKKKQLKKFNQKYGQNIQGTILNEIEKNISELQILGFYNFSKKRTCKLTGIDISCQRLDSFLLSHRGLHKLLTINPEKFNELKKIFLSEKWQTSLIQVQIKEIAHNIRTKYNYREKRFSVNQTTLFQNADFRFL